MAPSLVGDIVVKGLIIHMGQISEQQSPRYGKKIVGSSEFQSFLLHLSERAPSAMVRLLKSATRKCEDALRVEKEGRIARKRTEAPNRYERNAKRVMITCPSEEETATFQRGPESDSLVQGHAAQRKPQEAQKGIWNDMFKQSETPNSHRDVQYADMVLLHTSASDKDRRSSSEDSEEEDLTAKDTEKELLNVSTPPVHFPQENKAVDLPAKHLIEFELSHGLPSIQASVRASLVALDPPTTRLHFNVDDEIDRMLKIPLLLEFVTTQHQLRQYLENRVKMPGGNLQARTNWNTSNPSEILSTLENVKRNTADNKIHRAYGQTMLFWSVNAQVARGYKSTVTGHRLDHTAILEELARDKAGLVSKSEVEQTVSSYLHEYYAGQKWSAVIDWFGGSGIILVFVTAGIGSYYVEKEWTEFQRACLHHIAGLLHSIRGLVEALGSDALELYCRNGCLGNDFIDRVKLVEFTPPDGDANGDADADADEDEDEDEGAEDAEDEEAEDAENESD